MTDPMSVDRILAEELEELQFHNMQIIAEAAILEEARLMEEDVSAHPDPASEKDLQKFMKQANRVLRRQRLVRDCKKAYAAFAKVAVILLIIVVGGVCTVINVEAVRVPFLNWLINIQKTHTTIQFVSDADTELPDLQFGYIPENFVVQLDSVSQASKLYSLVSDETTIYVDVYYTNTITDLDTENAQIEYSVLDNQADVMIVKKDGQTQLVWTDDLYAYTIISNYDANELLKIANHISAAK